jgi:hypothetical protein
MVALGALLALAVLPACSAQRQHQTEESTQQEAGRRPPRSASRGPSAVDKAAGATGAVLVLGVAAAIVALPIVLIVLLL